MGFSPPLPAYRRVLVTVGCVFTVLPVPSVLWLCWIFVGPILMASEEFISFFIGISEMATCGVGVEMQVWLKDLIYVIGPSFPQPSVVLSSEEGPLPTTLRFHCWARYSIQTSHLLF